MIEPGHGGNPPIFRTKRGSEVRDKLTGAITRQGEPSVFNVNTNRLEFLLDCKHIEPHHHAAGRRLQRDWQIAELVNYGGPKLLHGASGATYPADAKLDAMTRVSEAKQKFKHCWPHWKLIELVVIEEIWPRKAAAIMKEPEPWGVPALRIALQTLAEHYRLA